MDQFQVAAGTGFAIACLWFLYRAYFDPRPIDPARHAIIKFICALCAGAAGVFLSGTALLQLDVHWDATSQLLFRGTTGFALFGFVWFTFPPPPTTPPPPPNGGAAAGGTETPFSQLADALASFIDATVDLKAFSDEERATVVQTPPLHGDSVASVQKHLLSLRSYAPVGTIRPYTVAYDAGAKLFTFKVT